MDIKIQDSAEERRETDARLHVKLQLNIKNKQDLKNKKEIYDSVRGSPDEHDAYERMGVALVHDLKMSTSDPEYSSFDLVVCEHLGIPIPKQDEPKKKQPPSPPKKQLPSQKQEKEKKNENGQKEEKKQEMGRPDMIRSVMAMFDYDETKAIELCHQHKYNLESIMNHNQPSAEKKDQLPEKKEEKDSALEERIQHIMEAKECSREQAEAIVSLWLQSENNESIEKRVEFIMEKSKCTKEQALDAISKNDALRLRIGEQKKKKNVRLIMATCNVDQMCAENFLDVNNGDLEQTIEHMLSVDQETMDLIRNVKE